VPRDLWLVRPFVGATHASPSGVQPQDRPEWMRGFKSNGRWLAICGLWQDSRVVVHVCDARLGAGWQKGGGTCKLMNRKRCNREICEIREEETV
jgi:hypothetical protein